MVRRRLLLPGPAIIYYPGKLFGNIQAPFVIPPVIEPLPVPVKTKEELPPEKIIIAQVEEPVQKNIDKKSEILTKPVEKEETVPIQETVVTPVQTEQPKSKEPEPIKEEPVPAEPPLPLYPRDEKLVHDFLESWRQAWESKEIDSYINSYDKSFRQGDKDLVAWKR